MLRITAALLLLSATSVISLVNETRLSELVEMVTNVIADLAIKRTGIVNCWFYMAQPDPQPDDLLETIQLQPVLQFTTKFSFKQKWHGISDYDIRNPYRMPTLLIMDLRHSKHQNPRTIPSLKFGVLKNTYVIIFINRSEDKHLAPIWRMLAEAALLNVIYLHTDRRENFHRNPYSKLRTFFTAPPSPIFPDQARDVHGYDFRASHLKSTLHAGVRYTPHRNFSAGPLVTWANLTTQLINATFDVTRVRCFSLAECHRNIVVGPDGRPFDMILDPYELRQYIVLHTAVRSAMSTEKGLIAPRSPKLEIHELFGVPFRTEVWITFVALLVTCVLLTWVFPNKFHNNLILLTLCSFERVALYRVKRLEKLVAISLIIFFFVLMSAYESLFISLMTHRPRLHNPRTVEDLVRAGVKVELWLGGVSLDEVNEELRPLIKNVSGPRSNAFDSEGAVFEDKYTLKVAMKLPRYFDAVTGESQYVMLDYSSWKGFHYHWFAWECPLVEKFRYTHSVLEESGLFRKLMDDIEHVFYKARLHQVLVRRFQSVDVMLGIYHLVPAWIVLAFGWALSFVSLVGELGWFKIREA